MVLTRFGYSLLTDYTVYIPKQHVAHSINVTIQYIHRCFPALQQYYDTRPIFIDFSIRVYQSRDLYTIRGNLRDIYYFLTHDADQRLQIIHTVNVDMIQHTAVDGEGQCGICMESTGHLIATSCGHVYHKSCLNQWVHIKRTCPMCRQRFKCRYSTGDYDFLLS